MRLLVTCGECLCEACAATRPIVSVPRRVNGEASARRAIVGSGLAERRLRAGKVRKEWLFIGVPNKRAGALCSSLLNRGTEKCAGVLFPTFCALGEGAARGNGGWAGSREGRAD
ncbi:hypothetical protein CapIbe_021390 [Capra ibex]